MMSDNKCYLEKEVKSQYKLKACTLCGCSLHSKNFARHLKTKKHKDVVNAYNKFEIEKYEPPVKKKSEYLILRYNFKKKNIVYIKIYRKKYAII